MNLEKFSFKLGKHTFTPNTSAVLYAVIGAVAFFTNVTLGLGLLAAAGVASSEYKHRVAAASGVAFVALLVSTPLLISIAFAAGWLLIYKRVRFAHSITAGIFAVAALLIGHVLSAVFFGVISGLLYWAQKVGRS